jgi:hypothetical protein
MRGGRFIGGASAALLVVAIGSNLYRFGRVEREQTCDYTLCLRPRSIESNALQNRHVVVNGRYPLYHALGKRLDGASLTLPPSMAEHRWYFERVARLRVDLADAPTVLTKEQAHRLRKLDAARYHWLITREGRKKGIWQDVDVIWGDPRGRYVLAETEVPGDDWFLAPVELVEAAP